MTRFEDLAELQEHLEERAFDYNAPCSVGDLFAQVKEVAVSKEDNEEADRASWEIDFFDAHFDTGEAHRIDFNQFNQAKYDYLESRLRATANPVLQARYAHILWCSPRTRHGKYAKTAVDSYLQCVPVHERQQIEDPEEHYGHNLLSCLISAHSLGYQANWKTDEVKAEFIRIISDFPFDNPVSFIVRRGLIEYMLKDKRKFANQDFRSVDGVCWKMGLDLIADGREDLALDFLKLGERVEHRTGGKPDR